MKGQLIIFVRAPRYGAVKKRLATDIGKWTAWRFYRNCSANLVKRLSDPRWTTVLAVQPDLFAKQGRFWPPTLPRITQGSGNLGNRLSRTALSVKRGPIIIVGSDIPNITRDHIASAFTNLGYHDAVLGPSPDGGYWLVGLRLRPNRPRPFTNVRWSSRYTLSDTLKNFDSRHRIAFIESLRDIDTVSDYRLLVSEPFSVEKRALC